MSIKKLKAMMAHPSGKEFHEKFGNPKQSALNAAKEPHYSQKLMNAGYSKHKAQKYAKNKMAHQKQIDDFHKKLRE